MMVTPFTTVMAEAAVVCEVLCGAALLLAWVAIEVIGYSGMAIQVLRRQRWFPMPARRQPVRDVRWGVTVRAAGLRRNLEFGN
jgi:hypothetical protein